MMGFHKR